MLMNCINEEYKRRNNSKEHNVVRACLEQHNLKGGMGDKRNPIIRKSLIYKTRVEYGDYTMNHIQGCSHGCKYPCYAFLMAKRFKKVDSYEEWLTPVIVENTLELLSQELPKYKSKIKLLHLCFTTDPFMYGYDEIIELTMQVIKQANKEAVACSILTKGILPKELAKLSAKNECGISLISLDEEFRKEIEPGASPYIERISALRFLHAAGCKTWVSIEPYPTPNIKEQNILDVLNAVSFVDKIIFGRTNYSKATSSYKQHLDFYNTQASVVIEFCKDNNIDYHIKNGTMTEPK